MQRQHNLLRFFTRRLLVLENLFREFVGILREFATTRVESKRNSIRMTRLASARRFIP